MLIKIKNFLEALLGTGSDIGNAVEFVFILFCLSFIIAICVSKKLRRMFF